MALSIGIEIKGERQMEFSKVILAPAIPLTIFQTNQKRSKTSSAIEFIQLRIWVSFCERRVFNASITKVFQKVIVKCSVDQEF